MGNKGKGISRRGFLASAAVGMGSLAMLSACSPSSGSSGNTAQTPSAEVSGGTVTVRELNPQEDYKMATVTDFSPLFQPVKIGEITLKNRFVKSPAGSDTWEMPDGDNLNSTYLDYYENFAKGGCAAVFTESAISKYLAVNLKDHLIGGWFGSSLDRSKDLMGPVVDRIHKHDSYAGFQVSPASVIDIAELTYDDIKWMQEAMVKLCVAYKNAGYDIGELHAAAQQPTALWTTLRGNKRTDEYGPESFETRTRFLCEVIQMIKSELGSDFPIQILMNATEDNDENPGMNDSFNNLSDCIEIAKQYEKAGADTFYLRTNIPKIHVAQFAPDLMFTGYKIEGVNCFGSRFDFSKHFNGDLNGQWSGAGILLKATAEFKKSLASPVSCAGYIDPRITPDLVVNAVNNGEIDYFMMTRPLTVDPEYVNKLQEGRIREIAPCTRCMHCHNKGTGEPWGDEWCRVNATTQQAGTGWNARFKESMPEGFELPPAETSKKVVVVGGGPAGMEAARIAALRGHTVTLFEKDGDLGGLIKTAHAFKGEHENLGELIDYLSYQQEVTGVTVKTGIKADAETIDAESPDVVVVATGGVRDRRLLSNDTVNVIGIADVVYHEAAGWIGDNVVILGAGAQAIDLALYLMSQGKSVQLIHGGTQVDVDKEQSAWVKKHVIAYLGGQGSKIWNSATVDGLVEGGVSIVNQNGTDVVVPCDTVVECYDMLPNTELYDSIKDKYEAYAIGDCANPWNIADAIITGNLTARKI